MRGREAGRWRELKRLPVSELTKGRRAASVLPQGTCRGVASAGPHSSQQVCISRGGAFESHSGAVCPSPFQAYTALIQKSRVLAPLKRKGLQDHFLAAYRHPLSSVISLMSSGKAQAWSSVNEV